MVARGVGFLLLSCRVGEEAAYQLAIAGHPLEHKTAGRFAPSRVFLSLTNCTSLALLAMTIHRDVNPVGREKRRSYTSP